MKRFLHGAMALSLASSAMAAPNVTNVTQKGSLLVFPDIRVDDTIGNYTAGTAWANTFNTLVRIQNDGSSDVDLKCYWMDGHKNRVDFVIPITRNQTVWFDARTGRGSTQINPFPTGAANGFTAGNRHPFLEGGGGFPAPGPAQLGTGAPAAYTAPVGDGYGPYRRGVLACWATDGGAQNQVKWNHLSGTATVYGNVSGAYEYSAYAFFVPTGADLAPVGVAGALNLNGLEYDACPLYQIGQFTPATLNTTAFGPGYGAFVVAFTVPPPHGVPGFSTHRLAVTGCTLNLNQDWTPVWTKLQFDVWNEEEVKFTGAYECADSWHDTDFRPGFNVQNNASLTPGVPGFVDGIDAAGQNFDFATLATYAARYRVQGVKSAQCDRTKGPSNDTVAAVTTQAVGLVAVQSSLLLPGVAALRMVGATLAAAGKFNGKVVWDPEGVVPESSR